MSRTFLVAFLVGVIPIVAQAQDEGTFRDDISATFASLCFYGAIEQLLSAWIFDALAKGPQDFEQAKEMVVETVCGGLEIAPAVPAAAKLE